MDRRKGNQVTGLPAPIPMLFCVECFGGFGDNKDNSTGKLEKCTKCGTVLIYNGCPKCMLLFLDRQLEDGSSPSLDFGHIRR